MGFAPCCTLDLPIFALPLAAAGRRPSLAVAPATSSKPAVATHSKAQRDLPTGILRHLQHWLSGQGPHLQTTEFVPETHAIRQWADTFPWEAMIDVVSQSFAQRFPKKRAKGGRAPVPPRMLLALELLKHELGESDEGICQRLRTDVAVMYACGLREVQADRSQAHFVLPETLSQFRRRIAQDLMGKLLEPRKSCLKERPDVSSRPRMMLLAPLRRTPRALEVGLTCHGEKTAFEFPSPL